MCPGYVAATATQCSACVADKSRDSEARLTGSVLIAENAGTCRRLQMAIKVARGYKAAFDSSFAFFLAYAESSRVALNTCERVSAAVYSPDCGKPVVVQGTYN